MTSHSELIQQNTLIQTKMHLGFIHQQRLVVIY